MLVHFSRVYWAWVRVQNRWTSNIDTTEHGTTKTSYCNRTQTQSPGCGYKDANVEAVLSMERIRLRKIYSVA